jgi:hypothetical protein
MSPRTLLPFAWSVIVIGALLVSPAPSLAASAAPPVPHDQRGTAAMERMGTHDVGNIRTRFWNFGMVGDFPADPLNVDLSLFHSVEAPKASGMNHSGGMTPFLLGRIAPPGGSPFYIMETGYRERQGISPYQSRIMRLEPRPGYFQEDPALNPSRSPAISDRPETWPPFWPDRMDDPVDPGWPGQWNGLFGKGATSDQETFMVVDDQYYDAWNFHPDARDTTRCGLALRFEIRGRQWSDPGVSDLILWHYAITNEGTTPYDSLVFGLYDDADIGGYRISCDGIYESDDDNAGWERNARLNLTYSWDQFGHGVDLSGLCSPTGFVGWSFVETPGDPVNGSDDDLDGLLDERPDSGPGQLIVGQSAIRAFFVAHVDTAGFRVRHGPLESRPAYVTGWWWTGDEDLDWSAADDLGADGVPATSDEGEGDQIPTAGEPDFDRTDPHESDQLGLTGFKMNRIRPGPGNPNWETDGILFYTEGQQWPQRLWQHFTNPDHAARFDTPVTSLYNIAYLAASGPFSLGVGETVRFSLALAYGASLADLRNAVDAARAIQESSPSVVVGVPGSGDRVPATLVLRGIAPNPFSRMTRIRFTLPAAGRVRSQVFDLQGRMLATHDAGPFAAGEGETTLDASGLPPGLYWYRLVHERPGPGERAHAVTGKLVVID